MADEVYGWDKLARGDRLTSRPRGQEGGQSVAFRTPEPNPEPPPPLRPAASPGVHVVTSITANGAVLTTYVGREPRPDVEEWRGPLLDAGPRIYKARHMQRLGDHGDR
jgi:hypothetical protein